MKAGTRTRILFGVIMIAALAAVLYVDWRMERAPLRPWGAGLPLTALLLCIVSIAFSEVARLARRAGASVLGVSGRLGVLALGLWPYWGRVAGWQWGDALVALAGLAVLPIFLEQMIRFRTADGLRRIAGTMLAVLYLGAGTGAILSIRMTWGLTALIWFLVVVKCTDMGAYFVGSAFGRHKLIPWLSPHKSQEGLAGGLAAGTLAGALAAWVMKMDSFPILWAAGAGLIVSVAGQFGDLCESLLKRSVRAKDSGEVVPQFGGLLDILDSPLLSAPVAWVIFRAIFGAA